MGIDSTARLVASPKAVFIPKIVAVLDRR